MRCSQPRPLAKFVLAQRTIYTGRRDRRRLLKVRGVSDSGYTGSSDITERFAREIVCRSCLSECVLVRMRGIAGDDVAWSGEYAVHNESQRTGKPTLDEIKSVRCIMCRDRGSK